MKYKLKDHIEEIKEMVSVGCFTDEIATKFNVTQQAIYSLFKKLGINPNKKYEKFSEDTLNKMIEMNLSGTDCISVARTFNTTQARVLKALNDAGIDTSNNFLRGDKAELAFRMYDEGKTQEEIAEYFGCYRQSVQNLFKKAGKVGRTQLEQKQITWYVNQDRFTNWNNEADLYFCGLLLSDGYVSTSDSIRLSLQERDKSIIYKFKEYIESSNDVKVIYKNQKNSNHQNVYSFSFCDRVVANNLRNVGFTNNKSCKEVPPSFLGDIERDRHFWRGYVDGDGSVKIYGCPFLYLCGGKDICQAFVDFCNKVLGFTSKMKVHFASECKNGGTSLYYTRISGRKARDIAYFLYNGSEYYSIERKYEVAMQMQNWQPKAKNKVYGVYKRGSKYGAYIMKDNKQVLGGLFCTEQEAIDFRLAFELEHFGYLKSKQ